MGLDDIGNRISEMHLWILRWIIGVIYVVAFSGIVLGTLVKVVIFVIISVVSTTASLIFVTEIGNIWLSMVIDIVDFAVVGF